MKNTCYSLLVTLIFTTIFLQNAQAQWSQNATAIYPTTLTKNVGIGTNNPTNKLSVNGTVGLGSRIYPGANGTENGSSHLHFKNGTTTAGGIIRASIGNSDAGDAPLQCQSNRFEVYTSNQNRLTITNAGNVGIGSNAPKSKLEVVGQDGICSRGFEPFMTIFDDNSGKSARIQAAHGDIAFFKGVPTGQGWNNYVAQMVIKDNGIVLIGTSKTPVGYKLAVGGKVICEELKVQLQNAWPDYVFAAGYQLKPLEAVEQHIAEKGHLPNIPSACEVAENGISVGEMQTSMMEKIEELTLYLIQQKKEIEALKAENQAMKADINCLK